MKVSKPFGAPLNDVNFINYFYKFNEIHTDAIKAAAVAFSRHTWYLTEELVPLSLFCDELDDEEKESIQTKLLDINVIDCTGSRSGLGFGKPILPDVVIGKCVKVSEYVGRGSMDFLNILGMDSSFLKIPVSQWTTNQNYVDNQKVVAGICVVNDAAERNIKICQDFYATSKSEQKLQNIVQVVEESRKNI